METKEERIIDAGVKLFMQHGFSKVTIGDIAQAAGMSRPTLYQVYANKEEVYLGLFKSFCERCFSQIEEVIKKGGAARTVLTKIFTIWVTEPYKLLSSSPYAEELFNCHYPFAQEYKKKAYAELEGLVFRVVKEATITKKGKMSKADVAHYLCASAKGFKSVARDVKDLEKLLDQMIALCIER